MEQTNRTILITGGAKRTGAVMCRAFARAGWKVLVHCNRSRAEAETLAEELCALGAMARVIQADLSLSESVEKLLSQCGKLDALINNASTYRRIALDALDDASLYEDYEINFFAPFRLMRAFAKQCDSATGGVIINLLDQRIAKLDSASAGYSLAKMSLADATRMCALAWAPRRIRINGIAPGYIAPPDGVPMSAMQRHIDATPLRCRTTEEQVANAALFLVDNPEITGEIVYLDGGLHLS